MRIVPRLPRQLCRSTRPLIETFFWPHARRPADTRGGDVAALTAACLERGARPPIVVRSRSPDGPYLPEREPNRFDRSLAHGYPRHYLGRRCPDSAPSIRWTLNIPDLVRARLPRRSSTLLCTRDEPPSSIRVEETSWNAWDCGARCCRAFRTASAARFAKDPTPRSRQPGDRVHPAESPSPLQLGGAPRPDSVRLLRRRGRSIDLALLREAKWRLRRSEPMIDGIPGVASGARASNRSASRRSIASLRGIASRGRLRKKRRLAAGARGVRGSAADQATSPMPALPFFGLFDSEAFSGGPETPRIDARPGRVMRSVVAKAAGNRHRRSEAGACSRRSLRASVGRKRSLTAARQHF